MQIYLYSGIAIGLICYLFLAWKINVQLRIGLFSGLIFGGIAGTIGYFVMTDWPTIYGLICQLALILFMGFVVVAFRFFRDPERTATAVHATILSPADGTVRYVRKLEHGEVPLSEKKGRIMALHELTRTDLLDQSGWIIGIEMSILDVHVNRSPVAGKIIHQAGHPGPFLSLRNLDSITQNERRTTVIQFGEYKLAMVQIASRLVRRIVSYVQTGEEIEAGQRVGMIKFGSQVDVVLPNLPGLIMLIKEGQHVLAGQDSLAQWQDVKE